jgi:hypothetical protein
MQQLLDALDNARFSFVHRGIKISHVAAFVRCLSKRQGMRKVWAWEKV